MDRAAVFTGLFALDDAVLHEGVDRLGHGAGGQAEDFGDVLQHRGLVHVGEKIADDADLAERDLLVVERVSGGSEDAEQVGDLEKQFPGHLRGAAGRCGGGRHIVYSPYL